MAQKSFYVDTCIWLNLFKKEGDAAKGIPYWKIAKDFIDKVKKDKDKIVVSILILKELSFKAKEKFCIIKEFFKDEGYIEIVKVIRDDYIFARKLESESGFGISFFDCLHVAISKRLDLTLITRDKGLIGFAAGYVEVKKPEESVS